MRRARSTTWGARLLLFAALLLGIATMHTLGHPTDHGGALGAHAAPALHSADTPAAGHTGHAAPAHDPGLSPAGPAFLADPAGPAGVDAPPGAAHALQGADGGEHGGLPGGADPMSVCLAVLGAATAVALLTGGLLGALRRRFLASLATAQALTRRAALPPAPPPPHATRLAQLSVLRV
ncbi:hypothetical protein E0L36_04060 [Streptomyces sp. AJS327]|uniref:hypothetical protein n=1 Tax=Streptomyces sp. AJS327 TaxID=2545265 RepID=UPI0015DD7BC0|nr:hypothetical protein [Streptomyces sp. AJS327]MBA0050102.1 hypothetical protein [Streptomyces sp. AJS327]